MSLNILLCHNLQAEFIEKDNDALHRDLEELIQDSEDAFLKSLFPGVAPKKKGIGSMSFGGNINRGGSKKLGFISVGNKFRVMVEFLRCFCKRLLVNLMLNYPAPRPLSLLYATRLAQLDKRWSAEQVAGWTKIQGIKITEEKVLSFSRHLQTVRILSLLG